MHNIAIIEYKENIDEALNTFGPEDTLFLSVSGEASSYLSEKKIDFITTEDVLPAEEFRDIGSRNFDITESWVRQLEENLCHMQPVFNKKGISPFRWHFHRMKILVDMITIKHAVLERLIGTTRPRRLGFPAPAAINRIHDKNLFFNKYDSIYGLIGKLAAEKRGMEYSAWGRVSSPVSVDFRQLQNDAKDWIRKSRLVDAILSLRKPGSSGKENILVTTLDYDIGALAEALSPKFDFYRYENPLCIRHIDSYKQERCRNTEDALLPEADERRLGESVRPSSIPEVDGLLQERISCYIKTALPALWNGMKYLEVVDGDRDFRAFFNAGGTSDSFAALPIHYFRKKGKPAIVVQHGDHALAYTGLTVYSECGHDGYCFAWGDAFSAMYDKTKMGSCRIISTGSHLIEKIRRNRKEKRSIKRVCYVQNVYRANTAYYPDGLSCCDSEFFKVETAFLKALMPFQDRYDITYKMSPVWVRYNELFGYNPMPRWVRKNLPSARLVSAPLASVINDFDCFIIDWPSTTLIQACASGAEVLVYNGSKYRVLDGKVLELLKKRAVIGDDEADFQAKIRTVLGAGSVVSDTEDVSFLEWCGIYKDDGKCLQRMVHSVDDVMRRPAGNHGLFEDEVQDKSASAGNMARRA